MRVVSVPTNWTGSIITFKNGTHLRELLEDVQSEANLVDIPRNLGAMEEGGSRAEKDSGKIMALEVHRYTYESLGVGDGRFGMLRVPIVYGTSPDVNQFVVWRTDPTYTAPPPVDWDKVRARNAESAEEDRKANRAKKDLVAYAEGKLCECGCGAQVRRRFLPGHDARVHGR